MNNLLLLVLFSILFLSCKKQSADFNEQETVPAEVRYKPKVKYYFHDSKDTVPISFLTYTYDENWNLVKELFTDPLPFLFSYTYEYSTDNKLMNKKYWVYSGTIFPTLSESDLRLGVEWKYEYSSNKIIEKCYYKNILQEVTTFTYKSGLLVEERYDDLENSNNVNVVYIYDSRNNLIKKSVSGSNDGLHSTTDYIYKDSRLDQELNYSVYDSLHTDFIYVYSVSGDKQITQKYQTVGNHNFPSEKITYQNGNEIEYIKYEPTSPGREWYCYRYEYFDTQL